MEKTNALVLELMGFLYSGFMEGRCKLFWENLTLAIGKRGGKRWHGDSSGIDAPSIRKECLLLLELWATVQKFTYKHNAVVSEGQPFPPDKN